MRNLFKPKKVPSFNWTMRLRFNFKVVSCDNDLNVNPLMSLRKFRFSSLKTEINHDSFFLSTMSCDKTHNIFNRLRFSKKLSGR